MAHKRSAWVPAVIIGMLSLSPAASQERYIVRVSAASSAPLTPVQSLLSGLTNLLGLTVIDSILGLGQSNLLKAFAQFRT